MADPAVSLDTVPAVSPVLDGNPLWELWSSLDHDMLDQPLGDFASYWQTRKGACRTWAFAVPAPRVIDELVAFAGDTAIHEVAAGSGYWAAMLSAAGAAVVATDATPPADNAWLDSRISLYHPVQLADATEAAAAAGTAGATLLLVWPPHARPMATDAVLAYAAAGGQRVVYVGEHMGGCTADDEFFSMFPGMSWGSDHEPLFADAEVTVVAVPNWEGVHDAMFLIELNA